MAKVYQMNKVDEVDNNKVDKVFKVDKVYKDMSQRMKRTGVK